MFNSQCSNKMERSNPIQEKSFAFSIRVLKAGEYLKEKKVHASLIGQFLRSGTSIGANVEEALGGYSRNDFAAKMAIAYKEARETAYWIRLFIAGEYMPRKSGDSLLVDCEELLQLLGSITSRLRKERNEKAEH